MYVDWKDRTIHGSLEYCKNTWGNNLAMIYKDERITYLELQRRVFQLTQGLKKIGVKKGTHVSCILTSTPIWGCLYYAIAQLGAVMVPLNITWVGREFEQGLQFTDAEYLIVMEEFRGKNFIEDIAGQVPDFKNGQPGESNIASLPLLKTIITVSEVGNKYDFAYDFWDIFNSGADYNTEEMIALGKEVSPHDDFAIMMTSGSTGFPKPAVHSHESFLLSQSNLSDCHHYLETDRFLHFCPTYHVAGTDLYISTHLRGGCVVHADFFDAENCMRIIEKEKITIMWAFDIMYLMMIRHPRFKSYDLSSLERILMGNSPSTWQEIKDGLKCVHHGNIYGTTESCGSVSHFAWEDRFDQHRQKWSMGRVLPWWECKIVDPETGVELPPNTMGEIIFKGPGLFKGYYKQPEITAAAIDADGFYHSGDWGYIDEDTFVYFRGRIQDTVKTGGENVSAKEVEVVLEAETPWVRTAQVFGVPDQKWGEAVIAMVELKPDASVTEADLRDYCKGVMANYKVPKRFVFVKSNEWIITLTGKFDKKALRERTMKEWGIEEGDRANLI